MFCEQATGWLIGQPHRGLAAMFVMMNSARLHLAMQGLGHLEAATQNAIRYANERTQFGAALSAQPLVRRPLWRLKALTSGVRVCAFRFAQLLDEADHHRSAAELERAQQLLGVLTPIAKAFFIHPQQHLESFNGTLQADAYGGYQAIYETGRVAEAACWAHAWRQFYELHAARPNALNTEALERINTSPGAMRTKKSQNSARTSMRSSLTSARVRSRKACVRSRRLQSTETKS